MDWKYCTSIFINIRSPAASGSPTSAKPVAATTAAVAADDIPASDGTAPIAAGAASGCYGSGGVSGAAAAAGAAAAGATFSATAATGASVGFNSSSMLLLESEWAGRAGDIA